MSLRISFAANVSPIDSVLINQPRNVFPRSRKIPRGVSSDMNADNGNFIIEVSLLHRKFDTSAVREAEYIKLPCNEAALRRLFRTLLFCILYPRCSCTVSSSSASALHGRSVRQEFLQVFMNRPG